jgi:HCOMODA/2-hydroxy-3-carboxy-muconic semialdehyde decarboxylase
VTFLTEAESRACVANVEAQVQRPWDLWVEQARARRGSGRAG